MARTTIEETYALIQNLKVPLLPSFVLFHNKAVYFPKILAVIVYLWSQAQIFLIISKATIFGLDEKTSPLIKVVQQLHQTLYMENLLSFQKSWGSDLAILILITLFLLLIGVMIGYILVVFFVNITPSTMIVGMLGFILRMHPFILFYPIHIIALQVLSYSDKQAENSTEVQPIEEHICFGLGIAIVIMNTLYSLAVLILLEVRIRTRSLISTKTILPNVIEFIYKFTIPFFWAFTANDHLFTNMILIVSLIYCLIRAWFLFGYLPYYKLSMLRLEAVVQALIIALASAAIIASITNYYRLIQEFLLFTLLWIVLSLCFGFLYMRLLECLCFQIILNPTKLRNRYYLIHFFAIYKAISKSAVLGLSAPKLNKWYFHYICFIRQSDVSHLLPSKSGMGWTVEMQTAIDRHFFQKNIELLEKFSRKNPEADLVKVTLAYYYAKNEDSFILATHILNENARLAYGVGHSMQLVKLTILQKLQTKESSNISSLSANKRSEDGNINIQNYLKVQETFKNLKIKVIDQVANQINFWKDFQGQNPDFSSLKTLAIQVYKKAYSIKQLSKKSSVFMKAGYPEPLLTLGLYFCFVQNDVFLGQKFMSEYYNLESRNKQKNLKGKADKSNEIALESPYLVIATSQNHLGKIIDCYGRIKPTLGFERETIVGKSINVLMPSSYAKYHDTFIRDSLQSTHPSVLNKAREVVLLRPDSYLILCRLYLSLRYLSEHGLCFSAVIRPLHDKRRLVLISEKGVISNFSENFGKDMGIRDPRDQSLNIFYFCPDLERVLRDFKTLTRQTLGAFRGRTKTREDSKLMFMPSKLSVNDFPTETFNQTETPKVKPNDTENAQSLYTVQTKEVNLTFCPPQNLRRKDSTRAVRSGKQVSIVYEAEIKKITIQNVEIFELKMKKASNINGRPLLTHQDSQQDYIFQSARNTMMSSTHRSTYQNPRSPKILKALDTVQSQKLNLKSPKQLNLIYLDDFGAKATEENYLLTSPRAKGDKDVSLISAASIPESMNEVSKPNPEIGKHQAIQIPAKALLDLDIEIYQESQPPMEESFRMSNSSDSEDEKITIAKIIPGINDAVTEGIRSNHPGLGLENFKGIATQKLLREVIESDKPNKATKYYHSSFIVTLVYLVAFLVWLNMYTSSTSKVIGNFDEVLSETSFRNYWTNTANQETRIWVGKRTLITSSSIAATIQSNNKSYQKVNEFNQNLRTSLGLMEDDILHLFNSKNISTYERNASVLELISRDNSFQVTNKIVNDGLKNVNKPIPDVVIGKVNNPQTQFIFDNSCNDLLVTSENLIAYLQGSIFDIIQSSRKNINIAFVITLVVLVAFSIISFVFVIKMNREFKVFMEVLFGLSLSKIKQTEIFLSKFSELISKESNPSQFLRLSRITTEKETYDSNNSPKTKINNRKNTHTASMKRIYRRNYLNFLGLFCALQCIVGFIIIYYSYAINKLNIMRKQHVSINTALKYINTLALASIGSQAMVMDVSPVTIRNIPVAVSLEGDLGLLKNISYLEDSLKDDDGILSSRQREIFSNITCDNAYSPLYSLTYQVAVRTCVTASNGLNRTGLIKALTNITTGLTQYLYDYSAAVKNENTTQQFFQRFYSNLLTPINLGSTLLLLAYTSANDDFVSLVKELETSRILLAWIACLVTIILGSITWFFVIRKLVRKELEKRKMLSLIPIQLIFENFRFRKYIDELAKDSGHKNLNLSKY